MKSWQTYYRPQKLADLHLTKVREQMLKLTQHDSLPHVLLFAGPRGTGKTSTARILAAMLINTKSGDQLHDPDLTDHEITDILQGKSYRVIEIDAASNRGIDDVRRIQEQVYARPAIGEVTVFIFDEVHMFTTEAFNALLKILEEPPQHAYFVLATTELHKIPATVMSRCTVVNFQRATDVELQTAFTKIIKAEKLTADDDALALLAQLADGSFRDGVKLLQTVSDLGAITVANINQNLVGNYHEQIKQLINIILTKDCQQIVTYFATLRANNVDEKYYLKNLLAFIYQQLVANITKDSAVPLLLTQTQAQFLLTNLLDVKIELGIPLLDLELHLLNIFTKGKK